MIKYIGEEVNELNKKSVLEIIELNKNGLSAKDIFNQKNISLRHIHAILNGEKWNNIAHIKNNEQKIINNKLKTCNDFLGYISNFIISPTYLLIDKINRR